MVHDEMVTLLEAGGGGLPGSALESKYDEGKRQEAKRTGNWARDFWC